MKKLFLVILALPVLATAGTVTVVSSFNSPDMYPNGLAWDGTNLWMHGGELDGFYEIDTSGTVLDSFATSGTSGNANGCTYDGTNLWGLYLASTTVPGHVYEFTTGGANVSDFAISGTANYCNGMAYDGSNLWISCKNDDTIYEFTTGGTMVSSFSSPIAEPADLGYDGTDLLIVSGGWIYKVTTSGSTVDSYDLSGICLTATGMTFDGSHFWVTDQTTDIVYELDPAASGIESASLGEIKASFK